MATRLTRNTHTQRSHTLSLSVRLSLSCDGYVCVVSCVRCKQVAVCLSDSTSSHHQVVVVCCITVCLVSECPADKGRQAGILRTIANPDDPANQSVVSVNPFHQTDSHVSHWVCLTTPHTQPQPSSQPTIPPSIHPHAHARPRHQHSLTQRGGREKDRRRIEST